MRSKVPPKFAEDLGINGHHDVTVDTVDAVDPDSREFPEAPQFPVGAMPRACQALINEAAASIGCPPEFLGLPMLVTLGSAVGNSRVVKLKGGWEEGAGIYGVVIAAPGEKKTPATKVASEPVIKVQAELRTLYRSELEAYKNDEEGSTVEVPHLERTLVEDTTVEALAGLLQTNPRGFISMRDELSGWVRAMDQYKPGGRGSDRQFWLAAWSSSFIAIDRKGQAEPLMVHRPFLVHLQNRL
jgi:hypothetical protein